MKPGIEMVMELTGFEYAVKNADLVITGEGRVDAQSTHGKVLSGIGRICRRHAVPAVAVVGGMDDGAEAIYSCGIDSIIPTVREIMTLETALARSESLCADAAYRLFSLIKVGMSIERKGSR
jgi:glycerate kinase